MAFHVHTEEQRELIDLVRKFGESEIRPHAADWDKRGECPLILIKWSSMLSMASLSF